MLIHMTHDIPKDVDLALRNPQTNEELLVKELTAFLIYRKLR